MKPIVYKELIIAEKRFEVELPEEVVSIRWGGTGKTSHTRCARLSRWNSSSAVWYPKSKPSRTPRTQTLGHPRGHGPVPGEHGAM